MSGESVEDKIDRIARSVEKVDRFLFEPPVIGQPSRDAQLDALLTLTRNSRFTIRAVLWITSAILAMGTAYLKISEFFIGK